MDFKIIIGLILGIIIGILAASLIPAAAPAPQPQCPTSLDAIKKRGVLVLGTSADWPPYEYVEGGAVVGIDIDIAKKIAQSLGVRLEVRDMKFSALIEAVRRGDVDIVLADMAITPDREKQVLFSIPYQVDSSVVIAKRGARIQNVEDLKGKAVGVQVGTVQEDWAVKNLGNFSKIIRYDKVYPYMVEALRKGDLDAIIVGGVVGKALVKRFPEFEIVMSIGVRYSAAAMPLCAQDLKIQVDRVIYDMLQTGEMERLINSWVEKWLYS
ncbi:ABC transporter substrate-binding protein [Pyrobaculum aerophilum]|uniref:Bacterial extracellular solute-binding proteins, family 3 n=2 Tax=Pyrobaculum aerophilum TaxID=13773 RepID=Q8ZU44_PYRAE|nr:MULTISPECIES: ABC transporter substrate-binding protein [Pyrobaculum]AAL64564.1 bacterial extracellular solute-binding proteins, family 3 [Pyrobaculum aerophilum str. IM2]MCX8136043.1 ABC transporter substrate-binding protein [Pyrobaculum aerophilum]HII47408.1 amino acid ABC transporter substrate-binding protein [Pyrobaculum aerophilum]